MNAHNNARLTPLGRERMVKMMLWDAELFSGRTGWRRFPDLGPVFRSATVCRLRHFATVPGLIPNSRLNAAIEACDRCIAALAARVAVALP